MRTHAITFFRADDYVEWIGRRGKDVTVTHVTDFKNHLVVTYTVKEDAQ